MKSKVRNNITAYLLLSPALICLAAFCLFPILRNIYLSFTSWDMVIGNPKFIGLDNYVELFTAREFYQSIRVTFTYNILFVVGSMAMGLLFALLLSKGGRISKFFRTVFFAPTVTSMVAMSAVWLYIFHPQYGSLNSLLSLADIAPVRWLNSPNTALISLVIMNIWKRMGFCSVVYLGSILNIQEDLLEAAHIDGANWWQRLLYIKIPMISPATFMLFILMTIESFQVFTQIHMMTGGGPNYSTTNLLTYMFSQAFNQFRVGYGSAIATVMLLMILAVYFLQSRLEKRVNYD